MPLGISEKKVPDKNFCAMKFSKLTEICSFTRICIMCIFILTISALLTNPHFQGNDFLRRRYEQLSRQRNRLVSRLEKHREETKHLAAASCKGSLVNNLKTPRMLCPRRSNGVALKPSMVEACEVHMQSAMCAFTAKWSKLTCAPYSPPPIHDYHHVDGNIEIKADFDISVWVMSREDNDGVRELEGLDATSLGLRIADTNLRSVRARINYAVVRGGVLDDHALKVQSFLKSQKRVPGVEARIKYIDRFPILSEYQLKKQTAFARASSTAKRLDMAFRGTKLSEDEIDVALSQNSQICFWNRFMRGKAVAMLEAACNERQISPEGGTRRFAYTFFVDGDTFINVTNLQLYMKDLEIKFDPFVEPIYTGYLTVKNVLINGGSGILISAAAMERMCERESLEKCLRAGLDENGVSKVRGHFDGPMSGGDMRIAVCAREFAGVQTSRELSMRSNLIFRPDPPWVKGSVWRRLYYLVNKRARGKSYDPFALINVDDLDRPDAYPVVSYHHVRASVRKGYAGNMRADARCRLRTTQVGWKDGRKGTLLPVVRCDPRFLILGGDELFASAVFSTLLQHPDVVPPIASAKSNSLGIDTLKSRPSDLRGAPERLLHETYLSRFPRIGPRDFKISGEVLAGYLWSPEASTFFRGMLPEAKRIILLTDPRARAFSDFKEKSARVRSNRFLRRYYAIPGNMSPTFLEVVAYSHAVLASCGYSRLRYSYCRRGKLGFAFGNAFCCPASCTSCSGDGIQKCDGKVIPCYVPPVISFGFYSKVLEQWQTPTEASVALFWGENAAINPHAFMREVSRIVGVPLIDPEVGTLAGGIARDSSKYGKDGAFSFDASALQRLVRIGDIPADATRNLTDIYRKSNQELQRLLENINVYVVGSRRIPLQWGE